MDNKFDLKKFLAENKKSKVLQEEEEIKKVPRSGQEPGGTKADLPNYRDASDAQIELEYTDAISLLNKGIFEIEHLAKALEERGDSKGERLVEIAKDLRTAYTDFANTFELES